MKTAGIIAAVGWILFVIAGFTAAYYSSEYYRLEGRLAEKTAEVDSGTCGNQQVVPVSSKEFAVAGDIVPAQELAIYRFQEIPMGTLVWKNQTLKMFRPNRELREELTRRAMAEAERSRTETK